MCRRTVFLAGLTSLGSQLHSPGADDSEESSIVGPLTERQSRLVARFPVPAATRASDQTPLYVEAEIVRSDVRPPYVLEAFVLVPIDPAPGADRDPTAARSFRRMPFGRMDVFAPLARGVSFMVFPDDQAAATRNAVKSGDIVLVGIEASAVEGRDSTPIAADVDVRVKRVVNW
jgi:hypothetical protein